jgi:DNA topoisomerase-6 subunit A
MAKSTAAQAAVQSKPRRSARRSAKAGRAEVGKRLENLAGNVVEQIHAGRDPGVQIPLRTLSNVQFNEQRQIIELLDGKRTLNFFNLGQAKKFMQTLRVAEVCRRLIAANDTTSIRDLFYNLKVPVAGSKELIFDDQSESDPIIEDVEVTVSALREELGVHAETKGAMVGPLTLVDNGDVIDLAAMGSGGWAVPSIVEADIIRFTRNKARFVLFIEKGAVWQRFNKDRFWETHKCLIIHGGGQPPRGVRRLIYRLHQELRLPVYVLVDNDPWGYYIYSVVKQGSIALAFESQRMAVPAARFIGMSSLDAERFELPAAVTIRLTDQDRRRAKEILAYPWFAKRAWQKEIRHMLSLGVKLELEALSNKNFRFITEQYLPRKMRDRQWLD